MLQFLLGFLFTFDFFHRNFDQKRENYKFSRSNLQFVRILLRAPARFRLSLHNVYVHASSVCVRNKESDGDNFHVSRVLCMLLLLLHSVYVYTTSTRTMAWKENQYWLRARFLSASFGRSFACLLQIELSSCQWTRTANDPEKLSISMKLNIQFCCWLAHYEHHLAVP